MALVTVSGAHLRKRALEDHSPTDMSASHFPQSKDFLRQSARKLRDTLPSVAGEALAGHLIRFLGPRLPLVIGGYWPIGSEIDPLPALRALQQHGAMLALPEATPPGNPLIFRLWVPGETLLSGRFGTLHPAGEPLVPDLLLVPLLAFDRTGHRLGYGGGYYDRTLAAWPHVRAIGLAHAAQELDEVPAGPYDIRLHAIATETGVIET